MIFPGDSKYYVVQLPAPALAGNQPQVTLVYLPSLNAVVTNAPMTQLGSTNTWFYPWSTGSCQEGDYLVTVSYATATQIVNGAVLEVTRLGNSRITGTVALDATVAHDATVAKQATVAKATDLQAISPDNSPAVAAIRSRTDLIPDQPAQETTLNSMNALLTDLHDAATGSWILDKSSQTLRMLRLDGSELCHFNVTEDPSQASRVRS
jgi:hypothetical protein